MDGSSIETIASGVGNTVGFDFDPKTGDGPEGKNQERQEVASCENRCAEAGLQVQ